MKDDVMSLFSSNININRILCQLSDRLVILDSAKNDKEENDDLYDIESIINASSVILVSELPKENDFIHNNYDDLNNDMSDSSEYQTTKNFSLSNGYYVKIVNIVEKDIANVWLFLLFSLANNQKYKTIRASLLEGIYTLAYVYMNMANTLLTYFRTNHFMIIDDDIVINKLGITCDDYYLYRNEHLTNTLIGAMESLLLISNDDYKNKMMRLKVIYNQQLIIATISLMSDEIFELIKDEFLNICNSENTLTSMFNYSTSIHIIKQCFDQYQKNKSKVLYLKPEIDLFFNNNKI